MEKSFPNRSLYCRKCNLYRFLEISEGLAAAQEALCDGTHTKLRLILQLEHTKRGAEAPLFLCGVIWLTAIEA